MSYTEKKKSFWNKLKANKRIIAAAVFFGVFLLPFVGIGLWEKWGFDVFNFYTFGIDNLKDFYTVWITLFGMFGVGYGIYQTQNRIEKQQRQIDLQTAEQRENRFAKAVELLGNANTSTRTGAAYMLVSLAKDFPKEYRKITFDILCAHIRSTTTNADYQAEYKEKPSNEIQTIINLIFWQSSLCDKDYLFNGLQADLSGAYLCGVSFRFTNFEYAIISVH